MLNAPGGATELARRNLPLDGLRGALALLVVVYHYIGSLQLAMPRWLDVTGLMGVDAFFVLSGYALARVYGGAVMARLAVLGRYLRKRVLRIAPLLFLATLAAAAPKLFAPMLAALVGAWLLLRGRGAVLPLAQAAVLLLATGYVLVKHPDAQLLPTFTLLWGFVDPTLSIAGGSWSIGVELVFYCLLPLLLVGMRWRPWFLAAALAVSVAVAVAWQLTHVTTLLPMTADFALVKERWRNYVAVPHHAYFFVAGVAVHAWQSRLRARPAGVRIAAAALLALLLAYVLSAAMGLPDHGWRRAWYAAVVVAVVASVALLEGARVGHRAESVMGFLGEISYSAYMLHFPVHTLLHAHARLFPSAWHELAATFVVVLLVSALVRASFEKSFDRRGAPRAAAPQPYAAA